MFLFVTRFFALIGIVVVLLISLGIAAAMHLANKPVPQPETAILTIDFDQPLSEKGSISPLNFSLNNENITLLDLLRAIDKAKEDPHIKGIVARFGSTQPQMAEAQELRTAIKSFRATGKLTYAFAPSYGEFGSGNRTYFLASTFENIWLQPVGAVSLTGISMESPFGKTALDKIGVKADFMQREEYKSFMDMATRDDFAEPVKANMQSILNSISEQLATGIADNRGVKVEQIHDLMARGPFTDEEALKEKLVTRLGYFEEMDDEIDQKLGKDVKSIDVGTYLSFPAPEKHPPKAKIALIYGTGEITDHDSETPSMTGDKALGADTIADAFDTIADDVNIQAILFRIDSPGGTPEASETIRHAMMHAQKAGKPVYVSMGEMAASGGYWIAMNADHIVAEPGTLTGSIGVLAGKFTIGGFMQKLGVNMVTLKTSENAGMWSMTEEFTPSQRERVNALLDNSYRTFTKNVSDARHIPIDKMSEIAKGRVWTGEQAAKIGLVDELGGFGTTLAALRKKLNLNETDPVDIEIYPPPETPVERVMKLLKTFGLEEAALRPILSKTSAFHAIIAPLTIKPGSLTSPIRAESIQ